MILVENFNHQYKKLSKLFKINHRVDEDELNNRNRKIKKLLKINYCVDDLKLEPEENIKKKKKKIKKQPKIPKTKELPIPKIYNEPKEIIIKNVLNIKIEFGKFIIEV
jgi:hypothetical protein